MNPTLLLAAAVGLAPSLQCELTVALQPEPTLQFVLRNRGPDAVAVLTWGTPFEGWYQPFVRVLRDGQPLPYAGPVVKRGDPEADEMRRLAAGGTRSASLALAPAFDLRAPGRYRVEPAIVLHDARPLAPREGATPRPRDRHTPLALSCPPVEFDRP